MAEGMDPGSEAPLAIALFGPFTLRVGGSAPFRPVSRKAQWLLGLLTLRHPRPVERAWLAGTLWPDCPEAQALYNLRRELTQLRGALGDAAQRMESPTPRTLRLDVTGVEVDLLRFDAGIRRGDEAGHAEAVRQYRGLLLEGCQEEWILADREARAQAFLQSLEVLAASALARGESAAATGHLRRVIAAEPLRESAYRRLMESLARQGDYAVVTQVYRDLRLLLHRELNAEPAAETRELFEGLRVEGRARAAVGNGASLRGARGLPGSETPIRSHRQLSNRIPAPLTALVGREQEVDEVRAWLETNRLVTLTGPGGVGKTRLAIEVARALVGEEAGGNRPGGRGWFVELAGLNDPAFVPATVAAAVGALDLRDQSPLQAAVEALGDARGLLVLDNCEHLVRACAALAHELLRQCARLRILATSRQSLGLPGELARRVPSLKVPPPPAMAPGPVAGKDPVAVLMEYDAVRLFVERASQAQPQFRMTPEAVRAAARVCQALDGIPLAIELAAARVRALSVERLAARLLDGNGEPGASTPGARLRLLSTGAASAPPQHRTLRAAIDWSHDLLSRPERALLRRLSVFAGGFTVEAAEEVCADCGLRGHPRSAWTDCGLGTTPAATRTPDELPSQVGSVRLPGAPSIRNPHSALRNPEVLDLLTSLVDRSLVIYEVGEGGERYSLLETVREYGRERLEASGEAAALRGRHLACFLVLAEETEPDAPPLPTEVWLDAMDRERDNLRAALAWGLAETGAGETEPEAERREAGVRLAVALKRFWELRGHWTEGRAALERALRWAPAVAPELRSRALLAAGSLAFRLADRRRALELAGQALALSRASADPRGAACALLLLGNMAWSAAEYGAADERYHESLRLWRELGDNYGVTQALSNLGLLAATQGDHDRAEAYRREAVALLRDIGDPRAQAVALYQLGALAADRGDAAAALPEFHASLALFREIGERSAIAYVLCRLGAAHLQRGEAERARSCYDEGLAVSEAMADEWTRAGALRGLSRLACGDGDLNQASVRLREALRIFRQLQSVAEIAGCIEDLGALELDAGAPGPRDRAALAARLLGAAQAIRESAGAVLPAGERADHEAAMEAARAALGNAAFDAAWAEGRALAPEEAIGLALRGEDGTWR